MPTMPTTIHGGDGAPALGDRWDTYPPQQGRIRFLRDDGTVAAGGSYRVVLSYGPGARYTMAWAVPAYRANGVPVVHRDVGGQPARVEPATREQAWERGRAVIAALAAAGVDATLYWCDAALVAVTELTRVDAGAAQPPAAPAGDRIDALAGAIARQQEPTEGALPGPAKRALFDEIRGLGLRPAVDTALVFVIDADEQEVELCRDDVAAGDIAGLIRAYWMLPRWPQRTCLVHLVADHGDPALRPVWLDILRAPDRGAGGGRHAAKALALAHLDGDGERFMDYFDDYERTRAEAARRLADATA